MVDHPKQPDDEVPPEEEHPPEEEEEEEPEEPDEERMGSDRLPVVLLEPGDSIRLSLPGAGTSRPSFEFGEEDEDDEEDDEPISFDDSFDDEEIADDLAMDSRELVFEDTTEFSLPEPETTPESTPEPLSPTEPLSRTESVAPAAADEPSETRPRRDRGGRLRESRKAPPATSTSSSLWSILLGVGLFLALAGNAALFYMLRNARSELTDLGSLRNDLQALRTTADDQARELKDVRSALDRARGEIRRLETSLSTSRREAREEREEALREQQRRLEAEHARQLAERIGALERELEEAERENERLLQRLQRSPTTENPWQQRTAAGLRALQEARGRARRLALAASAARGALVRLRAERKQAVEEAYQKGLSEGQTLQSTEEGSDFPAEEESFGEFSDDPLFEDLKSEATDEDEPLGAFGAWWDEHISGELGYRVFQFRESGPQDARHTRHEGFLYLTYEGDLGLDIDGLKAKATIEGRIDDDDYATGVLDEAEDDDERRNIGTLREAYLTYTNEELVVRAGRLLYSFGTGDLANPTDVINPIDWMDPFDAEKKGVLAGEIGLEFTNDEGSFLAFRGIIVPTFTSSRLPPRFYRYSFIPPDFPAVIDRPDVPPDTFQNAGAALRTEVSHAGWDLSATYYTGTNDVPNLRLGGFLPGTNTPILKPFYDRIHMFGADVATVFFDEVQAHAEAAQFVTEGDRDDDYLQALVGINYAIEDWLEDQKLEFILEYFVEAVTRSGGTQLQSSLGRPFRGAFLGRLSYTLTQLELPLLGLTGPLILQATGVLSIDGPDNAYVRPEIQYDMLDGVQLTVGADILTGPTDTFFGQFRNDDRVFFELEYSF